MTISLDLRPFILNTNKTTLLSGMMDYLGTGRKETTYYMVIFPTKVNKQSPYYMLSVLRLITV